MEFTMEDNVTKLAMTVSEAACRLGIGRNSAYEAVRRGEIPTIRIGKRLLVPVSALDRLLNGTSEQSRSEEPA